MNCLFKPMAVLASLAIISCGSTTSEETDNQLPVESQVQEALEPGLPGVSTVSDSAAKTTTGSAEKPVQATGALNPAHGMPGHRCDIAVGAPLNSPPATAAPATTPTPSMTANPGMNSTGSVQVTPVPPPVNSGAPGITVSPFSPGSATPTQAPPAAKTKTAPGMNPPHGEPGHDCAIAVGAPLKK